jgi:IPT/TIG domain
VANQTIGTYPFQGISVTTGLPDSSVGRSYFTGFYDSGIAVFDQETFAQIGAIPLPQTANPTGLVRWGTDGFALLNYNYSTDLSDLILVRSSLAQPSAGPNPIPVATTAIPAVTAGNGNFQLTVEGRGFVPGAVVRWNGADRTTIFQSGSVLIADIPASDVAVAGTAQVTVLNPPQGGGSSKTVSYVIAAK